MSKTQVSFDGVETLVLEFIGAQLLHQTDSTSLLVLVKQSTVALFRDPSQREMKLIVTVATKRMKDVPCRALRVNAHQWRLTMEITKHECECRLSVFFACALEGTQAEVGPTCWKIYICDLF